MKFQFPKWLRRPKYLWMNYNEIKSVRDQLTKLFLDPGQSILTAPPKGSFKNNVSQEFFGVSEVRIFGGTHPAFQWHVRDGVKLTRFTVWLKIMSDRSPWFDIETVYGRIKNPGNLPLHMIYDPEMDGEEVHDAQNLKFNDPRSLMVAVLIKAYANHFPFLPTRNHLGALNI